jgi:hypothetical protein
LGLGCGSLGRLWTGLRRRLRSRPVLGLRLRLNRTVLRLLGAELRLLRSGLRLDRTRLLGLDRSRVGLDRANLRLLGLSGKNLRLVGPVVWVDGADLRLARAGPVVRLNGSDLRLAGSNLRLAGPDFWLPRSYFRLAWAGLGLCRTNVGLAGAVSGIGAGEARLCGDGPGCRNDGRLTFVDVVELLTILLRFALMLDLGRHGRDSWTAHGFDLGRPWPVSDAASPSVVGDTGVVVDDDGAVVDVGDVDVDPVDGAVVVEVVAAPIAAVVADAGVAEAVVDAAVKADVGAPESAVKAPASVIPAPVARGPEGAVVGWGTPGPRDPVVAGGSPVPVAGGPDVVGRGGFRLLIDGQGWWGLVGVFDRRGFAFLVELLGSLRVLVGLVLVGRGRSGLLRRILLWRILLGGILLCTLLGLGLGADSEDCTLRRRGNSW